MRNVIVAGIIIIILAIALLSITVLGKPIEDLPDPDVFLGNWVAIQYLPSSAIQTTF